MTLIEFGLYLKELRGSKSVREAAKGIGMSHTYLDSLEKGCDPRTGKERKPTPKMLGLISDYYNVPYIDLMKKVGYM